MYEVKTETAEANYWMNIVERIIAKDVRVSIDLHNYVNSNIYQKTQPEVNNDRSQGPGLLSMKHQQR